MQLYQIKWFEVNLGSLDWLLQNSDNQDGCGLEITT